ncbi:MAG: hypothetical protein ACRCYP_02110 [Alphaproteobacteria bacterium]
MSPKEIRCSLWLYGYTVEKFAIKLGLSKGMVYKVINGEKQTPWIQQAIAKEIRKPINEVFPPEL